MFIHLLVSSIILTNKALEISDLSLFENTNSEFDIRSDEKTCAAVIIKCSIFHTKLIYLLIIKILP